MVVACTVADDDGRLIAVLTGTLDVATAPRVRTCLLKCLAEQPAALLVDVSGLAVVDTLAVAVFTSVIRQAAMWPGTPVLICAPSPATAAMFGAVAYRRLPLFATLQAARDETRNNRRALPTVSDDLLPVAGAARRARDIATEACARWDLPHLVGPASVVAGELVTNGSVHAGTMMTLRLSVSERYLHIAVRDGSAAEPMLTRASTHATSGRGLGLVRAIAESWGHLPTDGGKVVWAALTTGT